MGLGKWFRGPALSLFGTTRIPHANCDSLVNRATKGPKWVHVMFREWSYRIRVSTEDGRRTPVSQLEQGLNDAVADVARRESNNEACVPLGRLTADHRDTWANVCYSNRSNSLFAYDVSPHPITEPGTFSNYLSTECVESRKLGILSLYCLLGRLHAFIR